MKSNFCYFTGSNRREGADIAWTLLDSARSRGVEEDFLFFSTEPCEGYINHQLPHGTPWPALMKVDLMRKLVDSPYEYVVWLDTDHYFLRHPGDLKPLLRGNKIWVGLESDWNDPLICKTNWFGMGDPKNIVRLMRMHGCGEKCWNINAGMLIVRTECITEFCDRTQEIFDSLSKYSSWMADEPPMAILGATMVPDPELNTLRHFSNTWATDHGGYQYGGRLPDGKNYVYEEWATGRREFIADPAIMHMGSSKEAMARFAQSRRAPRREGREFIPLRRQQTL